MRIASWNSAEIAGKAHFPELFEPARTVKRRHPQGDRCTAMIDDQRTMNGPADGEGLIAHRAVLLLTLMICFVTSNGWTLPSSTIAAVLQSQAIKRGAVRIVGGLGPADIVGEALTQDRNADPHRAIGCHARRRELHFEVGVEVAPFEDASCSSASRGRSRNGKARWPIRWSRALSMRGALHAGFNLGCLTSQS